MIEVITGDYFVATQYELNNNEKTNSDPRLDTNKPTHPLDRGLLYRSSANSSESGLSSPQR